MKLNKNIKKLFIFGKSISDILPSYLQKIYIYKNSLNLEIKATNLYKIVNYLKHNFRTNYKILIDLTAIDRPGKSQRFLLYYSLLSIKNNARIFIIMKLLELESINSLTKYYSSAGWLEREVWDLFGIFFTHHSDLRRILTDYGFKGFPLRKDFPLSGFVELQYDEETKLVSYFALELTQEYRNYNLLSPWYLKK